MSLLFDPFVRKRMRKQLILHETVGGKIPLVPYKDTEKKLTVFVGYNITDRGYGTLETVLERPRSAIFPATVDDALKVLDYDLDEFTCELYTHFDFVANLDEIRQRVFLDMFFNLGLERFSKFKRMIAAAKREDWPAVELEMQASKWAKQVKTRAVRLRRMVLSGQDYTS